MLRRIRCTELADIGRVNVRRPTLVFIAVYVTHAACTAPPLVRPVEIVPRGKLVATVATAGSFGIESPMPGLSKERVFDYGGVARAGISERCDAAAGATMAGLTSDARCRLLAHDAPIAINPFAQLQFSIGAWQTSDRLRGGVGLRGGFDVAAPRGWAKPLASLGVGAGTAWYGDQTAPPPRDGPVGPAVTRRELRFETQLGVQFGNYASGGAFSVAFAPYWIVSESPDAMFDGFAILVVWAAPK